MSMEIKTVGIIGAGAIGSYFLWGMKELTESRICMIASGERKKRLEEQGLIINEETIHYPVKTPSEAHGVDLLLIATKYGALRDILDDVKTIVDEHTIVMSLLNGVDSEEIVGEAIGMEHMLYSFMRISAERRGNAVFFNPEVTRGLVFGEKGIAEMTERAQAVAELLDKTKCKYTFVPDILAGMWEKFASNISGNLPQAVFGVGAGAYRDSENLHMISKRLYEEVEAVASAKGIRIPSFSEHEAVLATLKVRDNARYSTLQDLDAGRHTEIDMFAGAMMRYGKEENIPVPFCEYTYYAIKTREEMNDGLFEYNKLVF